MGGQSARLTGHDGLTYTFERPLDGSEGEPSPVIVITATDGAGTSTVTVGGLTTDFTAPSAKDLLVVPSALRQGVTASISFTESEPLTPPPVVTIAGKSAQASSSATTGTYLFTCPIDGTEPEGDAEVRVVLQDLAGNSGTTTKTAVLDFHPPTLSSITVDPPIISAGRTVTISFDVNEELNEDPAVRIGGEAAQPQSRNAHHYVFTHMARADEGSGSKPISITVLDRAGNTAVDTTQSVTYDFVSPRFEVSRADPPIAKRTTYATLTFSSSESLVTTPIVMIGGDSASLIGQDLASFTFGVTIDLAASEGSPDVVIKGRDPAGNEGTLTTHPFVTDFTAPVILEVAVNPPMAGLDQLITINVTTSESMAAPPDVTIHGLRATVLRAGDTVFSYQFRTVAAMGSGRQQIDVKGTDRAGNEGTGSSTALVTDFSTPRIVTSATPSSSPEGSPVSFSSLGSAAVSGISRYLWNFGDGGTSTEPNPTHVYKDGPAEFEVVLSVTSGTDVPASKSLRLLVQNVSPTVSLEPITSPAKAMVTLDWHTQDPGTVDLHTFTLFATDLASGIRTPLASDLPDHGRFPWDTTRLPDSTHQLDIVVKDKDGGVGTAASGPVMLDNHQLEVSVGQPEPAVFNPEFGEGCVLPFSVSEAATVKVDVTRANTGDLVGSVHGESLVGAGQNAVAWDGRDSRTGELLADGDYTMTVRAVDMLGHVVTGNSGQVSITVTQHAGTPDVPVLNPALAERTRSQALTLGGRKEANTGIEVRRGGAAIATLALDPYLTWSLPITLIEGRNDLELRSFDSLGAFSEAVTGSITLKSTAPPPPHVDAPQSPASTTSQVLNGTKESGTALYMNGRVIYALGSDTTWSKSVSYRAGTTLYSFFVEDDVGNRSVSTDVQIVLPARVVTTPTVDPFVSPWRFQAPSLSGTRQPFTALHLDVKSLDQVGPDSGADLPASAQPFWSIYPRFVEGRNAVRIQSFDEIGSASSVVTTVFQLDTVAPSIQTTGVADGEMITTDSITLLAQYVDPFPGSGITTSTVQFQFDSGVDSSSPPTIGPNAAVATIRSILRGYHSALVRATDNAGNVSIKILQYYRWVDDGASIPDITLGAVDRRAFTPENVFLDAPPPTPEIHYTVNEPCTIAVRIMDKRGNQISSFTSATQVPRTEKPLTFNGRFDTGELVRPGEYKIELTPVNPAGRRGVSRTTTCEVYY